jgi:hypothetical protein
VPLMNILQHKSLPGVNFRDFLLSLAFSSFEPTTFLTGGVWGTGEM